MSAKTNIEWCDSTLNFWSGCTKVSPGCAHCYAETLSNRRLHESAFKEAIRLNRKPWICDECAAAFTIEEFEGTKGDACSCVSKCHRRRIFSLSLGDWLDDEVPIEWLARMLDTIRQCDHVIWILCTKRPHLAVGLLEKTLDWIASQEVLNEPFYEWMWSWVKNLRGPENVIVLASVENQEMADKRIPELLKIPAVCRGLSLEPLLGKVDLKPGWTGGGGLYGVNIHQPQLDWLILGGESGPGARPCNVAWIRDLVAQGRAAGVATFVKQLGASAHDNGLRGEFKKYNYRLTIHPKGGDLEEWPEDLRVREFPKLNR